jgi:hypothetical protein
LNPLGSEKVKVVLVSTVDFVVVETSASKLNRENRLLRLNVPTLTDIAAS